MLNAFLPFLPSILKSIGVDPNQQSRIEIINGTGLTLAQEVGAIYQLEPDEEAFVLTASATAMPVTPEASFTNARADLDRLSFILTHNDVPLYNLRGIQFDPPFSNLLALRNTLCFISGMNDTAGDTLFCSAFVPIFKNVKGGRLKAAISANPPTVNLNIQWDVNVSLYTMVFKTSPK